MQRKAGFLISKLPWCHARRFLNWREKYEIFWKPQVMAMSRMLISPFAKLLGASNPAVDDVVDERTSRVFFEEMGQIIGVQIHHGRKRIRDPARRRGAIRYMPSRWQQPCPGEAAA